MKGEWDREWTSSWSPHWQIPGSSSAILEWSAGEIPKIDRENSASLMEAFLHPYRSSPESSELQSIWTHDGVFQWNVDWAGPSQWREQEKREILRRLMEQNFLESVRSGRPEKTEEPPLSAQKLLLFALSQDKRENLIGDLQEEFQTEILPKFGPRAARLWYWSQVVRSLSPIFLASLKKVVRLGVLLRISDWISKIGS